MEVFVVHKLLTVAAVFAVAAWAFPGGVMATSPSQIRASLAATRVEGVPALGNVFLIIGENTTRSLIKPKHAPYLTGSLRPDAAWVDNYYALADGSLANYIGLTSGQYRPCDVANDEPPRCHQDVANVFSQLDHAGLPWQEWMESAANPCDFFDSGTAWSRNIYTTHHDPAVYYDNVEGGVYDEAISPKPECIANVLPAGTTAPNDTSALDAALASGDVGRYNLIIPNDCEQGHDPCGTRDPVRQFDAFLQREVPKIEASPAFGPTSVIFITWDEGSDPPVPNRFNILLAAVGPQVRAGTYDSVLRFDHYSLLRTIEDGLSLPHLAAAASAPVLSSIWK
jgi:phosphatidylinositol-3-phosphatase